MLNPGERLKKILFKTTSFDRYLSLISKSYFLLYESGLLKPLPAFKYHYFLKKIIQKGDVVIDIGANLGYFTRSFSRWVGKEGKVYALEPIQPIRDVLIRNLKGAVNVEVLPFALGEDSKPIRLGNDTRLKKGYIASGSHFVLQAEESAEDEFAAEMRKGSEVFANISQIHFIKCDVEGYETVILPEMREVILRHKPALLVEAKRQNRPLMINWMKSISYQAYIPRKNKLKPLDPGADKKEEDILFVHPDKLQLFNSLF
jgi:FkbM family methyltransferase